MKKQEKLNLITAFMFKSLDAGGTLNPELIKTAFKCADIYETEAEKSGLIIQKGCIKCGDLIAVIPSSTLGGTSFETRCKCTASHGETEEAALKNHNIQALEK